MSPEESKNLINRFFNSLFARDVKELESCTTDDVTWFYPIRWKTEHATYAPGCGQIWPRDSFFILMDHLTGRFTEGPFNEMTSVVSGDSHITCELKGFGMVGDKPYDNRYHFIFDVRDNRIAAIREYMDTWQVTTLLIPDSAELP